MHSFYTSLFSILSDRSVEEKSEKEKDIHSLPADRSVECKEKVNKDA